MNKKKESVGLSLYEHNKAERKLIKEEARLDKEGFELEQQYKEAVAREAIKDRIKKAKDITEALEILKEELIVDVYPVPSVAHSSVSKIENKSKGR